MYHCCNEDICLPLVLLRRYILKDPTQHQLYMFAFVCLALFVIVSLTIVWKTIVRIISQKGHLTDDTSQ